nr:unnamed protein product [Callosobruchus chinensis]
MAESEGSLRALIRRRGTFKAKLTLFDKYLEEFESLDDDTRGRTKVLELEQRTNNAETLLAGFDEVQSDIECEVDDFDEQYVERQEFQDKYYSLLSEQNNWMEFRDVFESMINNNIQINNIQKYHYLRASLTGTAQSVIQSFDFTHDNYSIAWSTLCDRFNNTELLVQNHLKAICGLESNLKRLGETTESWDTLLIYILKGKLDKGTAIFETKNYSRTFVTHNDACTSNQSVNSKYVCYLCKGDHTLFYCPDFHNMAVKDRVVKAKSMKVCLNCLKKNHTSADCRWSGCKYAT